MIKRWKTRKQRVKHSDELFTNGKLRCEHIWVKYDQDGIKGRKCIVCFKIDRQYDLE